MKNYLLIPLVFCGLLSKSQEVQDTTKKDFASIEVLPEFPGGIPSLSNYISRNLKYPEVAHLLGIGGKVLVSFVVDKDGTITDVEPKSCIGAGCEAEAVRLLSNSPKWKPGIQNNRPVRVQYTLPIRFTKTGGSLTFVDKLRKSQFGFIFLIKDKEYLIDDAEKILGPNFETSTIESADKYPYPERYSFSDKKDIYLIKIKEPTEVK